MVADPEVQISRYVHGVFIDHCLGVSCREATPETTLE